MNEMCCRDEKSCYLGVAGRVSVQAFVGQP